MKFKVDEITSVIRQEIAQYKGEIDVAEADKIQAGYKDGSYNIFTGPIYDQAGVLKVKDGEVMSDADLAVIDWFVKGVESAA